ncbi:MAG TPA: ABC transporter substrate-binding protein [Deltaproteobacteria bacterium]|nr:ABC transporter substrate-binding protein [Deltaproteobacteria bacterium]HIJ41441.1 ABC transporter substrate-binding protein [Deltaproteobacteria bacterium]
MASLSSRRILYFTGLLLLFFCTETSLAQAGDTIRIGALRLTSSAPIFIAMERGLFKEESLDVEVKFMKSAQPVAMALAAGDLDVGATGLTAGLYNAMANGLKIRIMADRSKKYHVRS